MSRAFVKEDSNPDPEPRYDLPDPESQYFNEAAARALIEGANSGDSKSAEYATGYRWGDPVLIPYVRAILDEASKNGDDRYVQLARRYLHKAEMSIDLDS
jgi:hypothetical protein